ncbi:glutamine--fructose-6-phosphate transaminase [Acidothermus cellulolyticus 11B]|uniref:Glutamine--fructose-6-phosphate aminotransferase [isomerizing] n=1 Tax=Acidothermus cellulolyticus (strain ATCC 43068 / DSM 8971 / 11B) TaxID=351607 RepID=A0LRQ8_ACIC1|nr:glutamine--fructose-6-phosphate transaminase (isomerizing) [Acidothermus cellulolyticus]ABK52118.1 glutamine--fructose-6-phosphate transaminase [Acidothermus cellulolyticus 11B]
MCGIVAYVGHRPARDAVLAGLRRLEYRGYDSAGIAVLNGARVDVRRKAGALGNLEAVLRDEPLPGSTTGIGHTRWATHGAPTDGNAHPHIDCTGTLAVVHNGVIENHAALHAELADAGHVFRSQTDTEVIAHLLEAELDVRAGVPESPAVAGGQPPDGGPAPSGRQEGGGGRDPAEFAAALRRVCRRLSGSFSIVAIHRDFPGVVVGARRNSPLVVGRGENEAFLASDVAAFIAATRQAVEIGQDCVVLLTSDRLDVTDFEGNPTQGRAYHVDWDASAAEKGGYDYFMLKEIAEQPDAVAATLLGRLGRDGTLTLDETRLDSRVFAEIDKIVVVACGSAYHAGLIAKYAIEHWAGLPCEVELASEFRYRDPILDRQSLVIAISQSGETLDTLMAVQHAREMGARVLAICNTLGATIPRESDAVLYTRAGPEIGVAATKTFLTQLVAVFLVALYLAQSRGTKYGDEVAAVVRELALMPGKVAAVLDTMDPVRAIARELADASTVLFLGRHVGYPVALEGALKLKELAYMHAEGFAAGELKHGPIALIEKGLPVVVVMPPYVGRSVLHDKLLANLQEIRARGAFTIVVAEEGDEAVVPYADRLVPIPAVPTLLQPLVAIVPLQVFACELAVARGNDVDRPRNLAKSVTVE